MPFTWKNKARNTRWDQPKQVWQKRAGPGAVRSTGRRGSGVGGWRFEEADLAAVAHQEGHGHHGDADAHGGEELVHSIGQHEGAGASCHPGLQRGIAETQLEQDGAHVHPAAETQRGFRLAGKNKRGALYVHKISCVAIPAPSERKCLCKVICKKVNLGWNFVFPNLMQTLCLGEIDHLSTNQMR